jgi:UDPglucose 6-dehydrogenase
MRITVLGLWHLGCVTAACLAEAGHQVIGLDPDAAVINDLHHGQPPLCEPGLSELLQAGQERGLLRFTTDAVPALHDAQVVWVTFDTPVDEQDEADVTWVERQVDAVAPALQPGTVVLISSQVPVGFTADMERVWDERGLHFAVSPENLRLGKALDCFRHPERIVVGCRDHYARHILDELLRPFCANLVWMSVESAEMTKHAVNAFLAASVTFSNELARVCEAVGADAKEVERGLKSEGRIGPKAYLSPGAAFAGGTLARDVRFLMELGEVHGVGTPFFRGVWAGNQLHKNWLRDHLQEFLEDVADPVVAVLGLTYKAGTSTLRRSSAVEICRWLRDQGVCARGYDPAIAALPPDLDGVLELCDSPAALLAGADVAVVATEWPQFRELPAEFFVQAMRHRRVIDANHFLASVLAADARIDYRATGKSGSRGTRPRGLRLHAA